MEKKKDEERNVRYYCPYNLPIRIEMRIISDGHQPRASFWRGSY